MSAFESAAAFAVRRPVAITVVAVAIALVGGLSWRELPVDLLPDLQSPTVVVSIQSGNRPPTEMERVYGQTVERMLTTVRGSRNVSQVARTGRLVTTVTFAWDADLDLALVDVQKAVGGIEGDPEVDEVMVRRFDPRQSPILTLGLVAPSGKPDLAELRQLARRQVAPALEQLAGVAEARVTGGREIEIRVSADRYRLEAFGVSLNLLRGRVAAQNVDIEAGTLEEGDQVFQVRGVARYRNAQDVADVVVRYTTDPTGASKAVRVSDLATVEAVDAEIDHLVLVDGVEGVGVSVYKEAGTNTVEVSAEVREALEGLGDDLPGVDVREIADDAKLVTDALDDLKIAAGAGVALAVLVLALFLRSAGATLIVTAAVPVSILAALFAMNFAEHSLNIVTLGGLALGAGMLVDNAIVVVESMYRRLGLGDSPDLAASRGTGQVAGAITASTLTTCVVFLPVLFVEGLAARLIDGIAFTVVVSLLASLAVAVFLIPALGRWFLPRASRSGIVTERAASRARTALENFVGMLLRRPGTVVLLATGVVAVAVGFLLQLGTELLAPSDPRQFSVRLVGPAAQRVESTARATASVEALIAQAGGGTTADGGTLAATLSEVGRLPEDGRSIRSELTEENTARVIARMTSDGPTGTPGGFVARTGTRIRCRRRRSSGRSPVQHSPTLWALADPLSWWRSPASPSTTCGEAQTGSRIACRACPKSGTSSPPSKGDLRSCASPSTRPWPMRWASISIPWPKCWRRTSTALRSPGSPWATRSAFVNVRVPSPRREQLPDVEFLSAGGRPVALGEVARFEEAEGPREVFRRDQRRVAQITAQLVDGFTQAEAVAAVTAVIADAATPPGTHLRLRGQEEERARTFDELRLAGILALVLVLMVLAGTFESLLQPITVLAAVPLALVGVAVALVPGGQPIGVMAMLGLIVLSGIAVNDAVLLLATARQFMAEGRDRVSALAAAAGIRLRPIVMTTLTTALAPGAARGRGRGGRPASDADGAHDHRRHRRIHPGFAARSTVPVPAA